MKCNINFQATGTTWIIDCIVFQHEIDLRSFTEALTQAIKDRLEEYENTYSRFRPNSLLSQIARDDESEDEYVMAQEDGFKSKGYLFPEDAKDLFGLYRKMYDATGGLVTPLIGQVISDAGYDASYSLMPKTNIQPAKKWDDIMLYEHPVLNIRKPIRLDVGAIGKGYAIDIIASLLKEKGITEFTINAGGDILHHSNTNIRIGLEHPHNQKQVIGVAEIVNKSICGSAGNRRAWGMYHHIINPETVVSPNHISAVWVMVDIKKGNMQENNIDNPYMCETYTHTTALADALTTGLFFVEPAILSQRLKVSFEYLIVYSDSTMKKSTGFTAEIF